MKNIRDEVDEKVFPNKLGSQINNKDYLKNNYPAFAEILSTFSKRIPKEMLDGNVELLKANWENYVINIINVESKIKRFANLYDQSRREKVIGYYRNIAICPYCGLNEPDTLDHFLPKTAHPLLSITLYNLIPCCNNCNHKKKVYDSSLEPVSFFNPYLNKENPSWLEVKTIDITSQDLNIRYAFNEAAFVNDEQKEIFKLTCKELDLLSRYACRSVEFILNQKRNIQKYCTKHAEIGEYFKRILKQLLKDDSWKTQLCSYIAESETAQETIFKYCKTTNRWFAFKNSMRGPRYKESLNDYLNYAGDDEKRNVYFLSDGEFKRRIVCIGNEIEHVSLEKETSLSVFVPGVIDVSDCKDAGFYVFDSQGCTGIRYKCIGCEHGVIVLKKDA